MSNLPQDDDVILMDYEDDFPTAPVAPQTNGITVAAPDDDDMLLDYEDDVPAAAVAPAAAVEEELMVTERVHIRGVDNVHPLPPSHPTHPATAPRRCGS